ncbi:MAG: FHA domain-containing protein, partial [Anaerolineae bacterium]
MEPTSYFDIQIDDPGQEHPGSAGRYTVRLGWIQGAPYLIDLGSAGKVLVNTTPIAPYLPVIIQAGDTITIGNTHLNWNPGAEVDEPDGAAQPGRGEEPPESEVPRVTVELPREDVEEPARTLIPGPTAPPVEREEPTPAAVPDATLPAPKRTAQPSPPEDPTLLVPERAAQQPLSE